MKIKEHTKCDFCGKDLTKRFTVGKYAYLRFCTKEHARLHDEGKTYRPKERKLKIRK